MTLDKELDSVNLHEDTSFARWQMRQDDMDDADEVKAWLKLFAVSLIPAALYLGVSLINPNYFSDKSNNQPNVIQTTQDGGQYRK